MEVLLGMRRLLCREVRKWRDVGHMENSNPTATAARMGKGSLERAWGRGDNFCFDAFLAYDGTPSFFSLCRSPFFFISKLFPFQPSLSELSFEFCS